jgi:hypothetical protein
VVPLGNFLFHTLLDTEPALGRPYPPYSWRSLRGDLNHLGGLAGLWWEAPGAPSRVELLPVWLDEHEFRSRRPGRPRSARSSARRPVGQVRHVVAPV